MGPASFSAALAVGDRNHWVGLVVDGTGADVSPASSEVKIKFKATHKEMRPTKYEMITALSFDFSRSGVGRGVRGVCGDGVDNERGVSGALRETLRDLARSGVETGVDMLTSFMPKMICGSSWRFAARLRFCGNFCQFCAFGVEKRSKAP